MSNVLLDIPLRADTQHRAVDLSSYQVSVYTRNDLHLKTYHIWSNLSVKYMEKIVDCYPQSDVSDGTEQLASLFLVVTPRTVRLSCPSVAKENESRQVQLFLFCRHQQSSFACQFLRLTALQMTRIIRMKVCIIIKSLTYSHTHRFILI